MGEKSNYERARNAQASAAEQWNHGHRADAEFMAQLAVSASLLALVDALKEEVNG